MPMEALRQDFRHALRTFRSNPLFAATAILALTLGIGANAAIFSVVDAVMLKPVPFAEPETLIQLVHTGRDGQPNSTGSSPARYLLWREQSDVLEDVTAYRRVWLNYSGSEILERISGSRVTESYFRTFRAPMALGRPFTPEEDQPGALQTTVISNDFWTRRLGSNPNVLGATLSLSGTPYTIVGVTAPEFDTREFGDIDIWVPFQLDPFTTDDGESLEVAARLKSGVSLGEAQARLASTLAVYRERFPRSALVEGAGFSAVSFRDAVTGTGEGTIFRNSSTRTLWLLLGAVACVLLIACANVASLMLIRASARDREIAVRTALGAGRWRIVRQLLTESALLSVIAGTAGLVLGFLGIRALLAINTAGLPRLGDAGSLLGMDWRIIGFTLLVSVTTAILFGLPPALVASRTDVNTVIKYSSSRSGTGYRAGKSRSVLIVAELALAVVLLTGAALLIRTTLAFFAVNPGFNVDDVIAMRTSLSEPRFGTSVAIEGLSTGTLDSIRAIPGVEAAAASCCVPLQGAWGSTFKIVGRDDERRPFTSGGLVTVSTGEYFEVFEIPVIRGRAYNRFDDSRSLPVVMVNRAFAETWWPDGQDPIGASILIGEGTPMMSGEPARQVIGVVENVRKAGLDVVRPTMYVPLAQASDAWLRFILESDPLAWLVRGNIDPMQLSAAVRERIRRSTGVPVTDIQPMKEIVSVSISRQRASMLLMTIFGGVALLLAAIGVYGLIAFSVQQRAHEIGIRMALGAERGRILGMIIRQGILLVAAGTAIGLVAAYYLTGLLTSILFDIEPTDPIAFIGVPLILMLVGIAAVSVPAFRASRVSPLNALRYE